MWTVGLNLYAARQADEGQRLKALMSQQVRQAFPELPVVLNPLQQARQQLTVRQTGAAADPASAFPACCNWWAAICRLWWAASTP